MNHRKILALLLCLALCAGLLPAAALAQEGVVITAFAPLGDAASVSTAHKPALSELEKRFPAALTVTLSSGQTESTPVTWQCREDYNEELAEFHFVAVPALPVDEGLEVPVIRVTIEGKNARAVMSVPRTRPEEELPIVGILTPDGRRTAALPSYYNSYEKGVLPPIRDQNPYGTCWAHSSIGCMEADLIHDGFAGTDIDLSELHLVYFGNHEYADEKNCNVGDTVEVKVSDYYDLGGYPDLSVNRLANLVGPAQETTVPYRWIQDYSPDPKEGRNDGCSIQLSGAYYLNRDDRDAIKYSILAHGAVDAAYCAMDSYYGAVNNAYYCPYPYGANHEIMLVGWDDNFDRLNFESSRPRYNGAWLVRNSWGGSGYGYDSYFWISYYDKSLFEVVTAMDAIPAQYDHCYAYNGSPVLSSYSSQSTRIETEQHYSITGGETICAVGIETTTAELDLSLSLRCAGSTVSQSYHTTYPGYYLVPLDETLPVPADADAVLTITYSGKDSISVPYEGSERAEIVYNAYCGSDGLQISESGSSFNIGCDSVVRLFTNDGASPDFGPADFTLPASIRTIEANAFEGLGMQSVYVPDTCAVIGARAFRACTELERIRLPQNCLIADTAFDGCTFPLLVFAPAGGTTQTWCAGRSDFIFIAE